MKTSTFVSSVYARDVRFASNTSTMKMNHLLNGAAILLSSASLVALLTSVGPVPTKLFAKKIPIRTALTPSARRFTFGFESKLPAFTLDPVPEPLDVSCPDHCEGRPVRMPGNRDILGCDGQIEHGIWSGFFCRINRAGIIERKCLTTAQCPSPAPIQAYIPTCCDFIFEKRTTFAWGNQTGLRLVSDQHHLFENNSFTGTSLQRRLVRYSDASECHMYEEAFVCEA